MIRKHRIFVAINLPGDIKKYLAGFYKNWESIPAKWTDPKNFHITLSFLGYVSDTKLGKICISVKSIIQKHRSFTINLNKITYGPDSKNPRMIWAKGESSKELSLLKSDLEKSLLEKINFKTENRGLQCHVTLGRIKKFHWKAMDIEERPEIDENIDVSFTVESIEVMESILKRAGSEYTIIESFLLQS